MIAFNIEEIKDFTRRLFLGTDFDGFLLNEAQIVTYNSFSIDGHIRREYYQQDGREEAEMELAAFSKWEAVKPICFSLIKGKRLPSGFHINLQAPPEMVLGCLAGQGAEDVLMDQVKGLYLHVRYEGLRLYCVTGTLLSVFTMDKTIDRLWDGYVKQFFRDHQIAINEE